MQLLAPHALCSAERLLANARRPLKIQCFAKYAKCNPKVGKRLLPLSTVVRSLLLRVLVRWRGDVASRHLSCARKLKWVSDFHAYRSVHLDSAIDPPHKGVCRQETNRAREQAIDQTSQEAVRKEQHRAHEARDVQDVHVVVDAVGEDPDARRAAQEEGLPPPVVVL